jgi:hypothetical protein
MAKVQIKGKILDISDTIQIGMIEKRMLCVKEIEGNYPQEYEIDFLNGKGDVLDRFNIGDVVIVDSEIRGHRWAKNGKSGYIVSLNGWRCEKIAESAPKFKGQSAQSYPITAPPTQQSKTDIDDLPF